MLIGRAAGVGNIPKRSEKYEGVIFLRPDEQQKLRAITVLERIPLAGRRVLACGALRLPMKASGAQRKVLIAC